MGPQMGMSDEPCATKRVPKRRTSKTYSCGNFPPWRWASVVRSGGGVHVFVGDQSRSFQFQHLGSQKIQVLNEFVQLGVICALNIRLVRGKTLLRLKSKRCFHEKRFCSSLRHSRYRLVNGGLNTSHAVPRGQAGEISSYPLQADDTSGRSRWQTSHYSATVFGYATDITTRCDARHSLHVRNR